MNTYLFKGSYTHSGQLVGKSITAPSYERAKEIFDSDHSDGITLLNCRLVTDGKPRKYIKLL